jgi:hypothetical protein
MTTPTVDCPRVTGTDALRILPLGLVLGSCYGIYFGWRADGYAGMLTLAVLERAAKTGIATAIGFFVAGKVAGHLAFSSLSGAVGGVVWAGVYDLPPVFLMFSTVLSGVSFGLLSRFGLHPGEPSQPRKNDDSDNGNRRLEV